MSKRAESGGSPASKRPKTSATQQSSSGDGSDEGPKAPPSVSYKIVTPKIIPDGFKKERARLLTSSKSRAADAGSGRCVVYWMSRDQRIDDNHAFLYAQVDRDTLGTSLHFTYFTSAAKNSYDSGTDSATNSN
jgi:hypothetical protein